MLKNLKLDRPIAFIDLETTGTNPKSDRIVELSVLRIQPDGTEEYKSHRVNPGVPIPANAIAVHGITDADVADLPMFRQYAISVRDYLEGCDISGFNVIKFDLPLLEAEFARVGIEFSRQGRYLIDSMIIYHQRDPRDLLAAYRKYCGVEMENAHGAEEDAKAAAAILDGQLEMYDDLPRDVAGLCDLCNKGRENYVDADGKFIWIDGEAVFTFGKCDKRRLQDVAIEDQGYLNWMLGKDFSTEVLEIIRNALEGRFPKP